MQENFNLTKFKNCNINDKFFDSLKVDYPEFTEWFKKKSLKGEEAYIYKIGNDIKAFMYIKEECEEISLVAETLPAVRRLKIGTLKIDEDLKGARLGEIAIGLSLVEWQKRDVQHVYVTVYEKHSSLVKLLIKFGFKTVGKKGNGEIVLLKDKQAIVK